MPDPKTITDWLGSFPAGINSGIDPLLLPKAQCAFAENGTFRGDFSRQRPPFRSIALSYATALVQTGFQAGYFQGAGYYKPDYGPESVAIAIGGRIFLFTPNGTNGGNVTEITISGDPNPSSPQQMWFCQAEQFLVCNDGLSLPFIYDGTVSRRSFGPSQTLGIVTVGAEVPDIGQSVNITLDRNYAGPLNQSILIDDATYVVIGVNGLVAYGIVLKSLYATTSDPAGKNYPIGTPVVIQPGNLGYVTSHSSVDHFTYVTSDVTFSGTIPDSVVVGSTINGTSPGGGSTSSWSVTAITNRAAGKLSMQAPSGGNVNDGWNFVLQGGGGNVGVGAATAAFVSPAVNGSVTVGLNNAYTGAIGQIVFIGTGQYVVTGLSNTIPLPANSVTVKNLTDTADNIIGPFGDITAASVLSSLSELPAGRMLVYGMGRIWECMTDGISFLAGDIVDGSSGSPAYDFRDAVLKVTENEFLAGGGLFRVPGSIGDIKAMQFVALLDASLGQGPMQVFTSSSVFSCQAPVDRSTWQSLTNPILSQALIGAGGCSQQGVSMANGDLLFRSSDGLIRSLLMARLDFNRWGNTPISHEVERILLGENRQLLASATSTVFDNRFIMGCGLKQANRGVYSTRAVALNFDPISSLHGKDPAIYDGQWDGLNVLQYVTQTFNGIERCFAICLSDDFTQIEIHEILATDDANYDDTNTPIEHSMESPVLFNYSPSQANPNPANPGHDYLRLVYGEIYVDGFVGPVQFQAYYKPDQWPNWVPWYSWTEPFNPNPTQTDPGFRPRIGLPIPDATAMDKTNNRPLREGYSFQFKLVMTGKCRFLGANFQAKIIPQPQYLRATPRP